MPGITWRKLLAATGLLVVLAGGCGGPKYSMNDSVEGTAKLDNKPLAGVMVMFVPDSVERLPSSSAVTDEQGHFKLTCDNKGTGAVIGKHHVVVTAGRTNAAAERGNDPQAVSVAGEPNAAAKSSAAVPAWYGTVAKTPLIVEITGENHTYDLTLTSSTPKEKGE